MAMFTISKKLMRTVKQVSVIRFGSGLRDGLRVLAGKWVNFHAIVRGQIVPQSR